MSVVTKQSIFYNNLGCFDDELTLAPKVLAPIFYTYHAANRFKIFIFFAIGLEYSQIIFVL